MNKEEENKIRKQWHDYVELTDFDSFDIPKWWIDKMLSHNEELVEKLKGMKEKELWLSRIHYPEELVNRNVAPVWNSALDEVIKILKHHD